MTSDPPPATQILPGQDPIIGEARDIDPIASHHPQIAPWDQESSRGAAYEAEAESPSAPAGADIPVSRPAAQAWLQVVASFALYFNHLFVLAHLQNMDGDAFARETIPPSPTLFPCHGLLNTFGTFQAYYEAHLLTSSSPSAISWIGSLQVFCLMGLGVLVGPLFDLGHSRSLLVAGTLLLALGFLLTSFSSRYWQILLSQGLCMGVGACCLSIPSIAIVPLYFPRSSGRRALAMGVACVGSGLGSTLYPLVFERLQPALGFGWAVRVMGLIALVMCVFATLITRPPPRRPRRHQQVGSLAATTLLTSTTRATTKITWASRFWDKSAFRDGTYLLFCTATFFSNLAFFNPPYYLQPYALTHGMAHSHLAPYLLAILNASSIPGRILPSIVADRHGCLETFIAVLLLSSASVFYWISAASPAGNVAFAALYGFFSGGVVSLGPVVLASVTQDLSRLGTRLGMLSVLKGIGSLVGPPISGALLDATGAYLGIQLFAGCSNLLAGTLALVLLILIATGLLVNAADKEEEEMGHVDRPTEEADNASAHAPPPSRS